MHVIACFIMHFWTILTRNVIEWIRKHVLSPCKHCFPWSTCNRYHWNWSFHFIYHCQILGQHENQGFCTINVKKKQTFWNHHNFVLKRSLIEIFDVLWSWGCVLSVLLVFNFADVDLLVWFRKGSLHHRIGPRWCVWVRFGVPGPEVIQLSQYRCWNQLMMNPTYECGCSRSKSMIITTRLQPHKTIHKYIV